MIKMSPEMEFENDLTSSPTKMKIRDFYRLVSVQGGTYEILTPDGFKSIGNLYQKKNKQMYRVLINDLELIGSSDHLVKIYTVDMEELDLNPNIEILDDNTWIRLGNLSMGDMIVTEDGNFKPTVIEKLGIGTTYDLEVLTHTHEYYSNGIVSHNTGKSAIAEGLAQKITQRKCSRILFNKRIVTLDIASMVAGTKYRGQFEERIKALMSELEKNPDIIMFIDEIHTIIGAGGASGSLDASNMFKPALARGEIQIIGATTIDEFRRYIEKDGALERRFQKVMVEPATEEETLQILENIKDKYESHHNVKYTPEAIKSCVDLTSRYMTDRFLPDKAIDALDESGSRVHISNIVVPKEIITIEQEIVDIKDKKAEIVKAQRYEEAAKLRDVERKLQKTLEDARKKWDEESKENRQTVSEENVAEVVSMMTGIPLNKVSQNENDKLSKMYEHISGKVVGQEEAVREVVRAIQRGRVGMKDENRPVFSGIFIGNSGVGKCLCKETIVTLRNKKTNKIEKIDISNLIYTIKH